MPPAQTIGHVLMDQTYRATGPEIRQALKSLAGIMARTGESSGTSGRIEIAVAEALNNISEHAYRGDSTGSFRLRLTKDERQAVIEVIDFGRPFPLKCLDDISLPDFGACTDDLPEGGFGMFLIHNLTDSTSYCRQGDRNCLTMILKTGDQD